MVSREYNRLRLQQYLADHPEIDRRIVLANESSMRRFLKLFHDGFGSIETFFEKSGPSSLHLARIRGKLLEE